jgi:hypothetical protein
MTTLNKILLASLGFLVVCFGLFIVYKEHQITQMQTQIQSSVVAMQQLQDNITRSQSQFATKADIDALAAANQVNMTTIQQNINSLNATLSAINVVNVNSTGQNSGNLPSSSTTPISPAPTATTTTATTSIPTACPNCDPFGYQSNVQNFALNEQFNAGIGSTGETTVPIGSVSFDAAQKNPWLVDIFPRKYTVVNVLATDNNGLHSVFNRVSITENGKDYPVDITDAKYEEQYPAASMSWWNPHLFFSANGGVDTTQVRGSFSPGLNVGFMSYGKTKVSPDISILQVGLGYELVAKTPIVNIDPINFNIGNAINSSLISNTYIGPNFGVSFNGNLSFGAGLSVGF